MEFNMWQNLMFDKEIIMDLLDVHQEWFGILDFQHKATKHIP